MLARRTAILLLVSSLALVGCKRKPSVPPDVIARVGERTITLADLKHYVEHNAGTELAQLTPEVSSAMLDQLLEEIVVSEYAAAHGIEVPVEKITSEVRNQAGVTVVEKRDEMRRERLIGKIAADIPDASPADVQKYYAQHQNEFRTDEELRVRQILVHDENLANQIVAELKSGASFPELSAKYSTAPNAKQGGEIGFVSRGELPKMFEDELFQLSAGQVSNVIRTESSFHIFQVDERRPAGTLDLEAATPLIQARMREDAVRDQLTQIVSASRKSMNISVLTRRLPFRYSGTLPKSTDE